MKFATKTKKTKETKLKEEFVAQVSPKMEVIANDKTPPMELMVRADAEEIFAQKAIELLKYKDRVETLVVTSEDQIELMAEAREIRLALREFRGVVENKRIEIVGEQKKKLAKIDSQAKAIKDQLYEWEDRLLQQEKFAENKELERYTERLTERKAAILHYGPLNDSIDYGAMTDEGYEQLLEEARLASVARSESIKRQQEEADARDAEAMRLKAENDRLKAQQEEMEMENKAILAQQAQKEWEAEQEANRIKELERRAANAPDKEKLQRFAKQIAIINVPACSTNEGIKVAADVAKKVIAFGKWIEQQTEAL